MQNLATKEEIAILEKRLSRIEKKMDWFAYFVVAALLVVISRLFFFL